MEIKREIPNHKSMVMRFFAHDVKEGDDYVTRIEKFERKVEKSLIKTLQKINIDAMVKSDPYSLPYNNEIIVTLTGGSDVNANFAIYNVARKIVKELLDKDVFKVRFYMFINIKEGVMGFGRVEYCFRYYLPKND